MNRFNLRCYNVALYPIQNVFQLQRMSDVNLCVIYQPDVNFRCLLLWFKCKIRALGKLIRTFCDNNGSHTNHKQHEKLHHELQSNTASPPQPVPSPALSAAC